MKLVYDVKALPKGLGLSDMVKILENHRVVFWDSDNGTKPKFFSGVSKEDSESPVHIVDSSGNEIDFAFYEREHKEKEFWAAELYKCKKSPIYFFSHYGTPVYPATSEGIQGYLKEIGLQDIQTDDSDKAADNWEKQKDKVKEASEVITLELIKEREEVMAVLKAGYEKIVLSLEKELADVVRLVDSNNVPITDKNKVGNLIGKIRKFLPVPENYSEIYRTKKGKWDIPILSNTPYANLLEMLVELRKA